MNKIYALKKNARQQIVPVAEIRRGVKKTSRSKHQRKARALCGVSILACMLAPLPLHASIVGTDLPYQTYRDFSENKGAFQPGATNIQLYDKTGAPYAVLDRAPMPDFSAVDRTAIATLISPQYVVSVKHNTLYGSVRFGYADDTLYRFSNRNNDDYARDFHSPRLVKLVTEVAPMPVTSAGTARGTYQNKTRFPVFYTIGSGHQYVKNRAGTLTDLEYAYHYRTGGTVGSPGISDWSIVSNPGSTYNAAQGPMASYGTPGDSGSPLFVWDAKENRWVLLAVTRSFNQLQGTSNSFVVILVNEFNAVMAKNRDAPVVTQPALGDIIWSYDAAKGTGTLTQGDNAWDMHGRHGSTVTAALDHGKDLIFSGGGTVILQNSVDQGAGSLTFNDDYTIKPADNQTWMGAGIIVNDNHVVDWGINGVLADSLHKLGTGTLTINGVGVNPGELSVGDGTVMLSQRADADGKVQAFDAIHIASGRPTVVLGDAGQVNPDNVRWGYRGGQLDVNGNNITVHRLNGADKGAVLTNRGPQATLNLDFNRTDTAATDTAAIANIWHGHFTGNLDVVNRVEPGTKNDFVIDGGTRLAGALHQSNGRLFLQGHPVVHAVNQKPIATKLSRTGDNSALTQPVSFKQDDWETRHFEMESLVLTDAGLHLGRNATLAANILARNSRVTLGSDELYIDLEDGNGVKTRPVLGKSKALVQADQSRFEGRVRLAEQSTLNINQQFAGGIDAIDSAIRVASTQAELTQPSEFTRSSLALAENAKLTSRANLHSDGEVQVGAGAVLSMQAAPQAAASRTTYSAASWRLQGAHGALEAGAGILLLGDIFADDDASVSLLGGGDVVAPGSAATLYTGAVTASQAAMRMHENSHWFITGDSAVNRLQADNALLSFGGNSRAEGVLPPQTDSGDTLAMREIQATSAPPSSVLTVDTLAASDSVFVFRADPYSGAHDQMTVTTLLSGSGNRLRAAYAGDEPAGEPVQARETLLISAPALTDANLFTPETYFVRNDASDIPAQTDPWRSGLAVSHDADQRQWWLISMSDAAPWRLTESREFDLLHLPSEERVELSQPGPAWTPHELRVDTLIASGVRFAMTARPQSHESDSIHIASLAQGDDNRLDLTLLVNDPVPADDSGALLLATAPAATLDSYFKPGSVTQGLTLYVPNLEIVSTDTEKKWQLAYRAVERPVEPPVEKPADPPVEKPADPPAEKPVDPPVEKPADPPAEKPADPPVEKPADPPVEKPADPSAEKPADPPVEKPADPPVEKPADPPVEKPADPPAEKPADPPVEKPADPPAEKPADPPAEKPADPPAEKPADPPAEKPADPPVEKPADPPVEKPADQPAEKPADPPVEKPVDPPAEKPADPPVEKPADPPVEKPADPPAEKPADPPVEKPVDPPAEKPADPPAEKPADPPVEKPADPPAEKPADPPVEKPVDPPAEKPADPPVEKPAEPPAGNPMDKPDAPVETARPNTGGLSLFTPYSLRLSELSTLQSRGEIINRLRQNGIAADDDVVNQVNALRQQVNRTAVLASLPKVAFVLETNQLNKRLGDVRQLHEEAGLWIKTSHGQADYQQVHLKHNTLQLGLDRKQGIHLYGVMGSYTQGSGQGDEGLSEKHTTGGIGVYYAMINEDGPFIDVIAKYLRTNHTYQMPANLRIEGHGAQSTSLLASVQAGWRLNLLNDRAFVEPSVEVVTGYTSAYTLHGDESSVDVRVNASTPVYAKIGAAAGLNFQSDEQRGVTLAAGLFRLQNLRRGGGIDVLNNSVRGDMLSTPMADDSRYLVNVSLNARLSPNWRFYSQVESSFAGKLKHDYSGQIGVRYQF
ncbi:S6 family peptidase [Achromobacter ruhlandii]|uniref:S6 family peptidase n=3 Tax=Achromobacter ruhlandii TaxID=72557 RepID=UPI0022B8754D|nr:S6 family peptidase [Achromobacter ruhlandii]MCZ8435189.1 autotransporter outer membrane beta-barrel domain-containing protein [Achromobacter ruhlandii]MDD7980845.1 S6 family peptidase [Achromobacter ruhlandii]